jgi:hypothetical protein
MTCVNINLVFSATQTTAAGTLLISLPTTSPSTEEGSIGLTTFTGTVAAVTSASLEPVASHAYAYVELWKSGLTFPAVYWSTSNFVTSTTYTLTGGGCYL